MAKDKKHFTVTTAEERCKGCGYCREVCPKDVFTLDGSLNGAGYVTSNPRHTDRCIGCNSCIMACPDLALTLNETE